MTTTASTELPRQRIALITGANRGLGRSTALHLARQGVDVIITYLNGAAQAADVVADVQALGRRAVALRLDVGTAASFAGFAEQVRSALAANWQRQQLDFLVNNAGGGINAALADTTEEQFDLMINTHLKGTFFLTQKLLPLIADGGRILNTSSGLARFTFPGYAAYASAKGGIDVLSRYMALELGPRGISVNVLAPGPVETDFGGGAVRDDSALNQQLAAMTALGRTAMPDDIGATAAALLLGGSGWITGQRIEASGGLLL
ncbi:SDR family NAD(P)-dependent oxidoreductase [Duganella sp. FT27W]|uniref:SDR family NAD(P)-dependent oxidoreductase n=1 Tax=Duganella sp. FT27W TaxID=2654636 RepID=UPI00128BBCB9|nr:SDR family oxidoreductase [Duganella sp. FT27W]MPQ56509.1 SDR family oxidoreductase [Duganella sp. FT27W]